MHKTITFTWGFKMADFRKGSSYFVVILTNFCLIFTMANPRAGGSPEHPGDESKDLYSFWIFLFCTLK
jgi:hypothetical protein